MVINEKENIPTGGERAVFLIRVEWCHINQVPIGRVPNCVMHSDQVSVTC